MAAKNLRRFPYGSVELDQLFGFGVFQLDLHKDEISLFDFLRVKSSPIAANIAVALWPS